MRCPHDGGSRSVFLFARKLAFPEKLLSRLRLFAQGRLWLLCPPQQVFPQLPSFCDLAVLYQLGNLEMVSLCVKLLPSVSARRECHSLLRIGDVTCFIDWHFNLALLWSRRLKGGVELDGGGMLLASSTSFVLR